MKKKISSVVRSISILKCFTDDKPSLTLSELSKITGINKAAVQRHTFTLEELGFLGRDENKRFCLGVEILSIGFVVLRNLSIRDLSYSFLKETSANTKQTINLWVLSGIEVILIERIEAKKIIDLELKVGSKLPVYCSSSGKAISAFLPNIKRNEIINKIHFEKFTKYTIKDKNSFKRELEITKARGYSILDQELSLNSRALGAPIFSQNGNVVAAVSIAVNASRFSQKNLDKHFSSIILELSKKISSMLGWLG